MADEQFTVRERWKFVIQAVVSVGVLTACLYVVLSNGYPDATKEWAFGLIGVVIGYWLR
jgi:hypothetical protein